MKFHKQRFAHHDPDNGTRGDCQRTVLACLLDLDAPEDVPHFMDIEDDEQAKDWMDCWLASRGLSRLVFAFDGQTPVHGEDRLWYVLEAMKVWNPGLPYCLIGQSERGFTHVSIYADDYLVHDPHPDGGGIVAPTEEGYYWVEIIVAVPGVPEQTTEVSD